MSTTTGDFSNPELPLGEKRGDSKKGMRNDMLNFSETIKDINAKRLERYHDLVGQPTIAGKNRDGVVRRVIPKKH